jgi:phage FluMu protein Com
MADDRPNSIRCAHCGKRVKVSAMGRIPIYCSPNCRQLAFMKNAQTMTADERYRLLTWRLLQDAGLVSREMPLPPRKPEDTS